MGKLHFLLGGASISAHMLGIHYNGIEFNKIQQVINTLPGRTTITKIEELHNYVALSRIWRIDIENDNFLDGTELFVKYKKTIQVQPGGLHEIDTFDGIDIIDPPAQTQPQMQPTPMVYTPPVPGNYHYSIGGSISPIKAINTTTGAVIVNIPFTPPNGYQIAVDRAGETKCCCGADSVGGLHSSYCEKASV